MRCVAPRLRVFPASPLFATRPVSFAEKARLRKAAEDKRVADTESRLAKKIPLRDETRALAEEVPGRAPCRVRFSLFAAQDGSAHGDQEEAVPDSLRFSEAAKRAATELLHAYVPRAWVHVDHIHRVIPDDDKVNVLKGMPVAGWLRALSSEEFEVHLSSGGYVARAAQSTTAPKSKLLEADQRYSGIALREVGDLSTVRSDAARYAKANELAAAKERAQAEVYSPSASVMSGAVARSPVATDNFSILMAVKKLVVTSHSKRITSTNALLALPVEMQLALKERYRGTIERLILEQGKTAGVFLHKGTDLTLVLLTPAFGVDTRSREKHTFCDVCESEIPDTNWMEHVTGNKHMKAVFESRRRAMREVEGLPAEHPPTDMALARGHVWCSVCADQVPTNDFRAHVATSLHQRILKERVKLMPQVDEHQPPGLEAAKLASKGGPPGSKRGLNVD